MDKIIIGIDPGANGGVAISDGSKVWAEPLGSAMDLVELLEPFKGDAVVYLEDLVKYTGRPMPSARMAVYASSWGAIRGVALALRNRLVIVGPKIWQDALSCGSKKACASDTIWKNKLKNKAQELFPQVGKITLATADALLILEYGRRQK